MSRARFGLLVAMLGLMALWGCGRAPSAAAQRTSRLQEEIENLSSLRDQLRKDLKQANDDKDRLVTELDQVVRERGSLREQLTTRTAERDQTQAHLDQIRRGVRALMEQLEAGVPPITTTPVTGSAASKPAGQS